MRKLPSPVTVSENVGSLILSYWNLSLYQCLQKVLKGVISTEQPVLQIVYVLRKKLIWEKAKIKWDFSLVYKFYWHMSVSLLTVYPEHK